MSGHPICCLLWANAFDPQNLLPNVGQAHWIVFREATKDVVAKWPLVTESLARPTVNLSIRPSTAIPAIPLSSRNHGITEALVSNT